MAEPTGVTAPPPPEPGPQGPNVAGTPPSPSPAGGAASGGNAVVEGEAIELPGGAVAGEPVAVVTPGAGNEGTVPLSEAGPAYASGHAHGTAPSWPEPILELAAERPEVVVGAAFVGGLLFAAILRRLGN